MKKLFTLIAIAAAVISCGGNTYKVKGSVTPTDDIKDAFVVMQDIFSGQMDTLLIVGDKFEFKGEADTTTVKMIRLAGPAKRGARAMFIPEKGTVTVDLDSANRVTAGPLTEKLQAFLQKMKTVETEEEFVAAISETFKANKANALGLFSLSNILSGMESEAELDEYLDGAADFIKENESVQATRTALQAVEETAPGKPFKDIKGFTAAGEELSLSDFAGNGYYTLIDFWASWCGPCRREIPFLIDIDKNYSKKNVQVVGINVWDKEPASIEAVDQLGIKYPVIFTRDDRSATDNYGVQGIPQIILIGPDGTILERNLRGEGIAAAIDKYVK